MTEARVERRLAAILAADVAGYSRLMGADDEGTLAALKTHRYEFLDPKIAEHRGRIVKTTGDGILVEFASIVDAARCAVDVQRGMGERNAAMPQDKRIEFRMGIDVGDVMIDGDDIFGDGVNVASRLESIAEPGGICVSSKVYEEIRGKVNFACEDRGDQQLKNIAQPVRVYDIRLNDGQALAPSGDRQEIFYCRAKDGVRLAYAISGHGAPLVKTGNWLSHLEYDWQSPVWRDFVVRLSRS